MKLFCWTSKTLKNYGNGYLITNGENIKQAKENIREEFKKNFNNLFPHLDESHSSDKHEIDEIYQSLENDLKENTLNITNNSILIFGSQ
jgi:hypothetical protein